MAIQYKVLGQNNPTATTMTVLYTVPPGKDAVCSTLNVCNMGATAATYRIAVRPAGALLAPMHYLAFDAAVNPNDIVSITIGISLSATDVIDVYSSNANLAFSLFGMELA